MKHKASRTAIFALLGLGMLGGAAFAQGEYDGSPAEYLSSQRWIHRQAPRQGPGWQGPGWQGPGWHGPGWFGPGVGLYVEPPRPRYRPRYYARPAADQHVEWCYDHYRSYREWDNSWQPTRGRRRECISPYY